MLSGSRCAVHLIPGYRNMATWPAQATYIRCCTCTMAFRQCSAICWIAQLLPAFDHASRDHLSEIADGIAAGQILVFSASQVIYTRFVLVLKVRDDDVLHQIFGFFDVI